MNEEIANTFSDGLEEDSAKEFASLEAKKIAKKEKQKVAKEARISFYKELLIFLNNLSSSDPENEEFLNLFKNAQKFLVPSSKLVKGEKSLNYSVLGKLRKFLPNFFETNSDKLFTAQDIAWEFFINFECGGNVESGFKLMASKGKKFHKELADAFWYLRNRPSEDFEKYWISAARDGSGELFIDSEGFRQYKLYGIGEQCPSDWPVEAE